MLKTNQILQHLSQSPLLKGFSIYFGTSIINKALPFFLLPVLTRYLSPAEYGILVMYQVIISFALPFVGMNMQNNITRNFFNKSQEYLAKLIFNLMIVLIATSTIAIVIIAVFFYFGGTVFTIPDRWVYVLPVLAMMNMINEFNLTIFRNQQRALTFGLYEILKTLLDFSVTLLLVIIYLKGWEGRVGGILVSSLVLGILGLIRLWKDRLVLFKVDFLQIREILIISLPLIPLTLGNMIISMSDRFFIERMVGMDALGIYSIGYQFGMAMLLLLTAFNRSWSPWMYQKLSNINAEDKVKIIKATYIYAILVFLLAAGVTLVSYLLIPLMTTKSFYGATTFVGWVAFGYAFHGLYTMIFPYFIHVGKTSFLAFITFLTALFCLSANYFLIKLNGTVGAAQAMLLSYIFMFICAWWYANKIFPMPWFKWHCKIS